jgi:hypothetical protein
MSKPDAVVAERDELLHRAPLATDGIDTEVARLRAALKGGGYEQ